MSIKIQNTPNRAAFDVQSAQDLRGQLAKNPQEGLKAAAQQFETMFLQMVMKSMRDTVPDDGMLNSEQSKFYTSLLDQQMAQNLASSGKGVGFAKLMEQQLGRSLASGQADVAAGAAEAANTAANSLPLAASDGRHLQYKTVLANLPTSAAYPRADAAAPAVASEAPAAPRSSSIGSGRMRSRHRARPAFRRSLLRCPFCLGKRLGAGRDPQGRWLGQLQPVRYQGRQELDGGNGGCHNHRIRKRPSATVCRTFSGLCFLRGSFPRLCQPVAQQQPLQCGHWFVRMARSLQNACSRQAMPLIRCTPTTVANHQRPRVAASSDRLIAT